MLTKTVVLLAAAALAIGWFFSWAQDFQSRSVPLDYRVSGWTLLVRH